MIDIHSHILPQVDDGSNSFSDSIKMIENSLKQGINHIILTPHALSPYMDCKFKDEIIPLFNDFKQQVKKLGININLYLGQEVSYHPRIFDYLKNDQLLTLNNSEYLLLELPYESRLEKMDELIYNLNCYNYQVIISHVERYRYYSFKDLVELKKLGVLFQINANSLNKKNTNYKKTMRLLKKNLVDFISSDVHHNRENNMKLSFDLVVKKFGQAYAKKIFFDNPQKIIFLP